MKRELPVLADGTIYDPVKQGARCGICPLKNNVIVPPWPSNLPPKFVFVGEAPGRKEELQGRPFVGMTGQYLRSVCREVGIDFREAALNNGAAVAYDPSEADVVKRIIRETEGGFDEIVDFAGNEKSMAFAVAVLARGGKIVVSGLWAAISACPWYSGSTSA